MNKKIKKNKPKQKNKENKIQLKKYNYWNNCVK